MRFETGLNFMKFIHVLNIMNCSDEQHKELNNCM